MSDARRCPDCDALVSADAEWCWRCFRPMKVEGSVSLLDPQQIVSEPASEAGSPVAMPDELHKAATWPCPACGNDNAIELDACALCGTSFAALMRQDDAPPEVDPKDALAWSLIFPGLGHRKVGRGLDGLARAVLFAMLFAMALVVFISGVTSGGLFGIFLLFMTLALAVYLGSAYEAYRMAEGAPPLVSARALLWATVGVILASIVMLALTVATAARR